MSPPPPPKEKKKKKKAILSKQKEMPYYLCMMFKIIWLDHFMDPR